MNKLTNTFIFEVLPIFTLLLFSFRELFFGTLYIIIGFVCILPFTFNYFRKNGTQKYVVVFLLLTFIGSLTNLLTTSNGIGGTILFLTTLPLALFCLTHLRVAKYIALIVLIYNLTFISRKLFVEFTNPEFIYEDLGLSRNYPGYLLVIWTIFWSFTRYITEHKIPVMFPILSLVVSFFL